jgi:hypothetical protein
MPGARFYRKLAADFLEDEDRELNFLALAEYAGTEADEDVYLTIKGLTAVNVDRPNLADGGNISEIPGSGLSETSFTNVQGYVTNIIGNTTQASVFQDSRIIDDGAIEVLREDPDGTFAQLLFAIYRYNVENANNSDRRARSLWTQEGWYNPYNVETITERREGAEEIRETAAELSQRSVRELTGQAAVSFLLNRQQGVLATLNERIIEDFFDTGMTAQRNIIQINTEDESLLINFLQKRPNLLPFFAIRTPYLSLLVPKIRLFKRVYRRQTDGSYTIHSDGDLEFKFKSFTENSDIEEITSSNFGRAGGAGIKSVNWSYEGTNPEAVRSFVNFDISLFFQSLNDFVGASTSDAEEALRATDNVALINLIGAGIGVTGEDGQVEFKFEITAQLGWELDRSINHDLAEDQKIRDLKAIISQTNTNLRLSLQEHNINFNEDGTLTLDISYYSAIDEVFTDESLNILRIGLPEDTAIQSIEEAREADPPDPNAPENTSERIVNPELDPCAISRQVTNGSDTSDSADDEEPTAEELAIAAALQGSEDENIIQNYNNIFMKMIQSNRIYRVTINQAAVAGLIDSRIRKRDSRLERSTIEVRYLTEGALRSLSAGDRGLKIETVLISEIDAPVSENEQAEIQEAAKSADYETGENLLSDADLNQAMDRAILERFAGISETDSVLTIDFIRLGDLLDNIISGLKEIPGTPLQERKDDFLFVTGLYTYREIAAGIRKAYNYSDMLISIDAFRSFFTEKIIRPLKVKYNLTNFIIDIANKFSYVNSVGMASQDTFVSPEGRPTFATFQAPDVGLRDSLRASATLDALLDLDFKESSRYFNSLNNTTPAYYGSLEGVTNPASSPDPKREISYFVLRSSGHVIQRDGDEQEDINEGIYHLKLGSDKGILKSVKFRKDEIRGRREGRIVRAGGLNLAALREKYDATITTFGAPFIYPGMYIYLNPSLIGFGDGAASAAKILGLGGYYFINKVRNSISSDGSFDTEIEASWNAFAGTDCGSGRLDIIRPPDNALNEILQASAFTAEGTLVETTPADLARERGDPNAALVEAMSGGTGGVGTTQNFRPAPGARFRSLDPENN